jgi:nicotinate phosphoribosyltransferase
MRGYEHGNSIALDLWEEVYPNGLTLLALTDTFSSKAFFQVRARFFPSSH